MEYEIHLSANVYNPQNGERFSIIETQTVELESFSQLDELMARMRHAVHPESTWGEGPNFYERISVEMFGSDGQPIQNGNFWYDVMDHGTVDHVATNPLDYKHHIRLRIRRDSHE